MENLDINTLEGWNNQAKILDERMKATLLAQGIEPTEENIKQGHEDRIKKCQELQLKTDQEQERLKAIAEEVNKIYGHSTISTIPMEEIRAICRLTNEAVGVYSKKPTEWSVGAVYLYGQMQGKREERGNGEIGDCYALESEIQRLKEELADKKETIANLTHNISRISFILNDITQTYAFTRKPSPHAALNYSKTMLADNTDRHGEESFTWFCDYNRILTLVDMGLEYTIKADKAFDRD